MRLILRGIGMRKPFVLTLLSTAAFVLSLGAGALIAQEDSADVFKKLAFRYIGPEGNRVISVVGEPSNSNVYYAGAASGGIFKSEDGGTHWKPIFDDQPVSSIGSLAIAPSDHQIVWAGTGETFIRSNISLGNGIYKSTDGGKHWKHMGLTETGRIGRVLVHPRNPDVVYACALGHSYGPQQERGVFRTTDGGANWTRVLFADENTGCADLAMDSNNPRVLFAGMWQLEIHTWGRKSGGTGSGLFVSRDGGESWTRLEGHGLPEHPVGKIAVGVAPSDSNRIYALIETADGVPSDESEKVDNGELWRSDDGGENWKVVSYDRNLAGRTQYYSRFAIAPDDENEVTFLSAAFTITLDGGEHIRDPKPGEIGGGDNHDMWIDPTDSARRMVSHDGGLSISTNRGKSWNFIELPIAQMYHVAVDNDIPYNVYGNRQDGPSTRGPSNSLLSGAFFGDGPGPIPRESWHSVGGGESGFAIPDPVDSNIVWATASGLGSVGGIVDRFNEKTRQIQRVEVWPDSTLGWPAENLEYRFQWTFPLAISPHDRNTIYVGSQFVHKTTDGGRSWTVISPDLTRNDKERQLISGGLTPDNVGVEYAGVVFAIAESPRVAGTIWAGTNDGRLQITRDGGASWTDVTANVPGLPDWGTVSNIEPSRYDDGTAYVTFDLHQANNRDPFVYKTTDFGRSFKAIVNGIPKSPLSYAHCVREDPVRRGLLYLGTENALYVSFDDGGHWLSLQNNLPHAPMHWMTVQEHFDDLVVATYGRGFWILDDLTPLQQLTAEVTGKSEHLMAPRAAYRFIAITGPMSDFQDQTVGVNPPYGASIHYYLKAAPADDAKVQLVVTDAKGGSVRTVDGTKEAGVNRVWWDLGYEPSTEIKLRTKPLYAPYVEMGADGTRPYRSFSGRIQPLAPPGTYSVALKIGDREVARQKLEVRKDPRSEGTLDDIEKQVTTLLAIRDDMNAAVDMVHELEWTRKQLYDLKEVHKEDESITNAADELDKKLIAVEGNLVQLKLTGRGQDALRWPAMLVDKLSHLANGISTADFAPTTQQIAVHEKLRNRVSELKQELERTVSTDVAAFNAMLREKNVPNVSAKTSPK
jgi:photosystem II stability/assembly factor-like uncharacterized protein